MAKTLVYAVSYSGVVSTFNAATGALVWKRSLGSRVASSPAVHDGVVYIGDLNGKPHALGAATGAVRCTFTLPVLAPSKKPGRLISSPVVGNVDATGPTVFVGDSGSDESNNGGHSWAITGIGDSVGACREKWMYDKWQNKGTTGTLTGAWDEPALARNSGGTWEVVFGTSNPDQSVYALDAAVCSRLWRFHTLNRGPDEDVGAGAGRRWCRHDHTFGDRAPGRGCSAPKTRRSARSVRRAARPSRAHWPCLGGLLVVSFGWRAVFVSAVLLSLGAWALVRRHVREPVASAPPATDWAGAVLLAAVVLALVLGMFQVHDSGIGSLPALALLGAAVLTAGGFLIVERRVSAPTLDLRLLRSVEFSASSDVGISAVAASKPGVGSLMSAYRTPATPPPGFA